MKASVAMVTYNQGRFIAQAIESVLMQEVDFDYEIVIGEDCSTDNTRDIIIDFQKRYPDRIRLLLRKRNLGPRRNFEQTLRACQGEYVALLDGDDYWTSPHKLQKQVDFLDSHPECAICFHNASVIFEDGSQKPRKYCPVDLKGTLTIEDLVAWNYIHPVTAVFRNGLVYELPEEFRELALPDWPRFVLIAQHGKIGYINEVMGAWRVHSGGAWTHGEAYLTTANTIKVRTAFIEFYEIINEYLEYRYDEIIKKEISWCHYALARAYWRQQNWKSMRKHLIKGFFRQPCVDRVSFSSLLRCFWLSLELVCGKVKRGRLD